MASKPRNQTELSLPFAGEWLCYWGGDSAELNWHHGSVPLRFGFDFVKADDAGRWYRGNVRHNDNSYSFGEDILSPGPGEVVAAVSDMADRRPGRLNRLTTAARLGNFVMIGHSDGEFSVLAHLKRNSLRVKPGDAVEAGQKIGQCGNSGSSTDAHLHYHMQDAPDLSFIDEGRPRKARAKGVKVYFSGVVMEAPKP